MLLCVLANPPLTSGARTLSRVELACATLGFGEVRVENLFATPSRSANDISALGKSETGWTSARHQILETLGQSAGVLLAYGMAEPTGLARGRHREQVAWLQEVIAAQDIPVFQFGDGPRHPSRWHRWTSRVYQGLPFVEAMERSIMAVCVNQHSKDLQSEGPSHCLRCKDSETGPSSGRAHYEHVR